MNLSSILQNMKNPIDDLTIIREILSLYDYTDNKWFSDKLFDDFNADGMSIVTNTSNDSFFRVNFKNWHDNINRKIVELTKEYDEALSSISLSKTDEEKRDLLNKIKAITNELKLLNELYEYVDRVYKNQYHENKQTIFSSLAPLFRNSQYSTILKSIPFSNNTNIVKKENALYIKMSKDAFITFSRLLEDKFNKDGIPFIYKCGIDENDIVRVVFYSSNEYLEYSINTINELIYYNDFESKDLKFDVDNNLKKINPAIKDYTYAPPILTSRIGYVGYSVQTDDSVSFVSTRTRLIEKSIKEVGKKYLSDDISSSVRVGNKDVSLKNYISLKITQYCLDDLIRALNFQNSYELGYTKKEIEDGAFRKSLYDKIRNKIEKEIDLFINGKENEITELKIKVPNGNAITIKNDMIIEGISSVLPLLISKDVSRIKVFQSKIKSLCPLLGIDSENFANNTVNKNKQLELINKKDENELQIKNSQEVFYNDIVSHIGNIQNDMLKSPKGMVTFKEYVLTYIYPLFNNRLSEKINYSSESFVDCYTFIKNNILGDCQNLYDGNLSIYLKVIDFKFAEKTDTLKMIV